MLGKTAKNITYFWRKFSLKYIEKYFSTEDALKRVQSLPSPYKFKNHEKNKDPLHKQTQDELEAAYHADLSKIIVAEAERGRTEAFIAERKNLYDFLSKLIFWFLYVIGAIVALIGDYINQQEKVSTQSTTTTSQEKSVEITSKTDVSTTREELINALNESTAVVSDLVDGREKARQTIINLKTEKAVLEKELSKYKETWSYTISQYLPTLPFFNAQEGEKPSTVPTQTYAGEEPER